MFFFSLAQTDARVAAESASDADEDLQKFIVAKQREKVLKKKSLKSPKIWQKLVLNMTTFMMSSCNPTFQVVSSM